MTRLLLNLLIFQAAWWFAVLSAAGGRPSAGLWAGLVALAAHLANSPARRSEVWLLPLLAGAGYVVDSAFFAAGWLSAVVAAPALDSNAAVAAVVAGGAASSATGGLPLAPLWILGLWLAFTTTLTGVMRWFLNRPLAAAALGALSGPASYAAGAALGALRVTGPTMTYAALAGAWAALLAALVLVIPRVVPARRLYARESAAQGAPPARDEQG